MSASSETTTARTIVSGCAIYQPSPVPPEVPFIEWVQQLFKDKKRPSNDEEYAASKKYDRAVRSNNKLRKERGRRYENCRFSNYTIGNDAQIEVVEKLRAYAKNSAEEIAAGRNVVMFGPKGTGKDHLLMALAYECGFWSGACVRWVNGIDLAEEFKRIAMDRPSFLDRLCFDGDSLEDVDVLWISDPLPPSGALSEFQQAALFQLIDKRYSDMKPTWVTLNVASADEAEERMGGQVVDRLRHGALRLFCNWPSHRVEG